MTSNFLNVIAGSSASIIELTLPQTVDEVEFDKLNEALRAALDRRANGRWVLDLANAQYIGSAILGLMVNIRQEIKQHQGRLVLCCLSDELLDIFHTCCMERLFTIAKTRPDALRLASGR